MAESCWRSLKIIRYVGIWLVLIAGIPIVPVIAETSDETAEAIILESLISYPGNCPCPYNTDRAGHSCGKRSAYSKLGSYSPVWAKFNIKPSLIRGQA